MRVGVFGATGYAGREVVRLLGNHPTAELAFTTGSGGAHLPHEEGLQREADAYLLSLPHGVSAAYVAKLRRAHPGATIVDLSGDLRLPSEDLYRQWYGHDHPAPELLGSVPYGLTEVYRERLRGARLIANPGCYATSALLPLVPLLRKKMIEREDIVIDAKSGATGAGRTPREELLFCEVQENLSAYSPGRLHRHVGEMEAVLAEGHEVPGIALTFCPHLLPVRRGILSAIYVRTAASAPELSQTLRSFYADAPFVRVVERPPSLADVVMSNDCLLSAHACAPGRAVVFSAIDNLVKGAAGQAIQNLNLAMGWPETAGLPSGPLR